MEKLTIVKVGGKIVEEPNSLKQLLSDFSKIRGYKVLVHGGGRSATSLATKLGIESKMVNGRRITDGEMLKVVTMVYGGLVNKQIVAGLQAIGVNGLGLSGCDLNYMRSEKRPVTDVDYGYVGDVKEVNAGILVDLILKGVVPVLAPLTHDNAGNLLNTNADTIASSLAIAMAKFYRVKLIYCFEKNGVLSNPDDESSVIEKITESAFVDYKAKGVIHSGMIPKLDNAYAALKAGVSEIVICGPGAFSTTDFISGTSIQL